MADFNFKLNRQGPQGPKGDQGEKGDNGNTPIFSEGVNTPTEYTLLIDYGNGSVGQTGNLRPPTVNNGGTYLRYNVAEGQYEIDDADKADLDGNYGEVRLATNQNVEDETVDDNYAVSYELFDTNNQNVKQITDGLRTDLNQNVADLNTETQNRQLADTTLGSRIDNLDTIKADKMSVYTRAETNLILNGKANVVHTHTLSQITDAGSLAGKNTVDYSTEVTNKPTIGNGTITITQGGVTKGTFTTNQSGDSTIALDAGGGGGSSYYAGQGINIDTSSDIISVKVDRSTIDFDLFGNLKVISSATPSNMVTTDTLQDITAEKYFKVGGFGDNYLRITVLGTNNNQCPTLEGNTDHDHYSFISFADNTDNNGSCLKLIADNADIIAKDRSLGTEYPIIHTGNIDGTTITYDSITGKISAVGSVPSNIVTTDTAQTITGSKTFRNLALTSGYPMDLGGSVNTYLKQDGLGLKGDTGCKIELRSYYGLADIGLNGSNDLYINNTGLGSGKIYVDGSSDFLLQKSMLDNSSIVYNTATSKCESRLILESTIPQVSVNNKATISGNTLSTTLTYWSDGCSTGYFQLPTTIDVASDYLLFELDFTLPNNDGNDSGIFGLAGALISTDDQAADSFANFFVDRYGYSGGRFSYDTYTQYNDLYSNLSQSGTYKCRIEIDAGTAKLYVYDTSSSQWNLASTITGCSGNINYLIFGSQNGMGSYSAEATFNLANCGWTTDRNFTTLNNLAATTVNRQVQSINTSYLNVDVNGQLTLSDDVIAKLNSIT